MDMKLIPGLIDRDIKLRISVGEKNLGKVTNKTTTWTKLVHKMSTPLVDVQHTLPQYLALSKERQAELKNVGFFVGGHCDNGIRRIGNIKERWVVTLDVDECSTAHVFDLECGMTDLSEYEFFVYSTRKHTSEKPRLRIIVPLNKPVDAEEYHALSRILAEKFDDTMESIDPVSYRVTQLMYWPSVCKDADFYTYHNRANYADPQKILKQFGDWQDHTKLPRSERDSSLHVAAGKKPEDPTTKEGLVGAFCKVYDVPLAIETFLPKVYVDPIESGGSTRYTFSGGTTSHGAIVYDEGKFLYSNHMHDPASGHSQNAFDLVRIHLYGDQDQKIREGTPPMSHPSVKAMVELLKKDKSVSRVLRDAHYSFDNVYREDVTDDDVWDDEVSEDTPSQTDWMDELELTGEGLIKSTMNNLVLILINDNRFKGCVRKNLFSMSKVYMNELDLRSFSCEPILNHDKQNGTDWTDTHTRFVKLMLESPRGKGKPGYGLRPTKEDLNDAIDLAADRQAFHPVKSYLESIKWDGKKRMERVFIDYLGSTDDAYHREVCRLTLLAAVTRIYEPGHKFDYMPILEGSQGKMKSTFVATLGRNWFREMGNFEDKNRAVETMAGAWIIEFDELHQFNRAEVNSIKHFLSVSGERTRLAFARNPQTFLRQCIFIGTVNEDVYLRDVTGNRRFWPVKCLVESVNIDKLKANIDQIWAETLTVYRSMRADQPYGNLPLYLANRDIVDQAKEIQASRKIELPEEVLAAQIQEWLDTPTSFADANGKFPHELSTEFDDEGDVRTVKRTVTCSTEIYEKVMHGDRRKISSDKSAQFLIGKAMQLIPGWERSSHQGRHGSYGKQYVIYRRLANVIDDDEL